MAKQLTRVLYLKVVTRVKYKRDFLIDDVFPITRDIKSVVAGDEILSVNNVATRGLSHAGAISLFKQVKEGKIELTLSRRR